MSSAPVHVSPALHHLFIGTYTKGESRGIYTATLDSLTGALSEPTLAAETTNPSFLAFSPRRDFLYAVAESPALAVGFAIGPDSKLTPLAKTQPAGATAPCHIAIDATGQSIVVTHYGEGFVASVPIQPGGALGQPSVIRHHGRGTDPVRQSTPHTHSVTLSPDNRFALVCDLGLDRVFTYALDPASARLQPANPPFTATAPGAGPRHSAFSPDGRHVYVINEMGGTLSAYAYDAATGSLSHLGTQPTLPPDFKELNTTAEVRVHPNGRFVYGSNRGHDSIAIFARDLVTGLLKPVDIVPSGGKHPRNFSLSPDGGWLVCANMNSDTLIVFRVDPKTGRLTRVGDPVRAPMPVCILFQD
ncbi:MAG TPA: lactonase family protein [Opitutaceae bacterium]|nr:lactonase family protein [Opitutaceae bacterium]